MPESMIPTIAPEPVVTSQAAGNPDRASHHWTGVPGGASDCCWVRPGSFGSRRKSRRHSAETLSTAGSPRRRAIAAAGPSTVAMPSAGSPRPARSTPVRAITAPRADAERAVEARSNTTSQRPVGSAAVALDESTATRERRGS